MKNPFSVFPLVVAGLCVGVLNAVLPEAPAAPALRAAPETFPADVTQHHKHDSRDGLYLDPLFTQAASANLARDLSFDGTIVGNVYAQPLFLDASSSPIGPVVYVVTESNNVYALNAVNGSIIWQRNVGTPITSGLPCGNINPLGITGTPVIDIASRTLFLDAEVTPSAGVFKHMIYSLNGDTGAINAGWPIDVGAVVSGFDSSAQSSRAALGLLGGIVYVPYGGRFGDCGNYRGRLVGVPMNNPAGVMSFATTSTRAGIWGPGGVASDGTNPFVTTGNGSGGTTWSGSEAVIRLQPGPVFSGSTTDYWAPTNWASLDSTDTDLGGSGAIIVDVPGATPSALVVALGKDGNAYLLNRSNLGGVGAPVAQSHVGSGTIIQAAATYRTAMSTYVAFRANSSTLTTFRITATNPPTITSGWSVTGSGRGSPFVTTTDGSNNTIVWVVGAEGDQRLHGYDGDTGNVVFGGGGANELMAGTQRFNTAIAARGRIYVGPNNKVYAFNVPSAPSNISGTISYCSNPVPGPVPNVTLTLTGTASGSTLSDGSGNYQFSSLASGGSYTVTPTKATLAPGTSGINTSDAIAVQRHFLNLGTPLSGCQLMAADVNIPPNGVNTSDAIAIQRFFLIQVGGLAQVGTYVFNPVNRSYSPLVSNQTGQNYDTLILGDVAPSFVEGVDSPSQSAAGDDRLSSGEVVSMVALPEVAVNESRTNFIAAVTTSEIDPNSRLVGFQGDFTFDERVITFQSEPVQKAGLTAGNWNVSGNVLPGTGPIRTLRISAFSLDFAPLSGTGTLFEMRMIRVSQAAQWTSLLWAAPPDHFIFIDADLNRQKPGNAAPGRVTSSGKRK